MKSHEFKRYLKSEQDNILRALSVIMSDSLLAEALPEIESGLIHYYLGVVICPVCCEAPLEYMVFGPDLLTWGYCKKPNCVVWIE